MLLYTTGSCLLYPSGFAVPSSLRGAAYIFVYVLKLGVVGVWVAMVSDLVKRAIVFAIRFKHGKWKENKVI